MICLYEILDDNIISTDNGIGYIFKLPKTSFLYSDMRDDTLIVEILKKIKMRGEVVYLSSRNSKSVIKNRFDSISCNQNIEGLESIRSRYIDDAVSTFTKVPTYSNHLYLVLEELREKKGVFGSKGTITKRQKKICKELNEHFLLELQKINGKIMTTSSEETYKVLNYISTGSNETVDNYVLEEDIENIKCTYENDLGEIQKVLHKYCQVQSLPKSVNTTFSFMRSIIIQNYSIDFSIKFDIELNNMKLEKKLFQAKNNVKDAQRKYERDNKRYLEEYFDKIKLAEEGEKEFQKLDNFMINFQLVFRIQAIHEDMLMKRYEWLKRILKFDGIQLISSLGEQMKLYNHFQITNIVTDKYINNVDSKYFSQFNLCLGNEIGLEKYRYSIPKVLTFPDKKPVYIDEFASLSKEADTLSTTSITAVVGVSGSGKSQISNNNKFSNMIVKGISQLLIDPKGDRIDIASKLNFSRNLVNTVVLNDVKYKGALDPFRSELAKTNEEYKSKIKSRVSSIMIFFLKEVERMDLYDQVTVTKCIDEYVHNSNGDLNFEGFLNYLSGTNKELAQTVLSFKDFEYACLFFSSNECLGSIDFTSLMTIVVLGDLSSDVNTLENRIKYSVLQHIELLVMKFMKETDGLYEITFDELEYFNDQTGLNIDSSVSKLIRSFGGAFEYSVQNFHKIKKDVLEQTSSFFIGAMKSQESVNAVCKHFNLNSQEFMFLKEAEVEGKSDDEKYFFLYVDPNGRKAKVRMEMLDMFKDAFDTKIQIGVPNEN